MQRIVLSLVAAGYAKSLAKRCDASPFRSKAAIHERGRLNHLASLGDANICWPVLFLPKGTFADFSHQTKFAKCYSKAGALDAFQHQDIVRVYQQRPQLFSSLPPSSLDLISNITGKD